MPTGYTAFIEDGDITNGKDFLLLCSRAFGVAMELRDEPLSVSTPTKFEPQKWYKTRYEDALKQLKKGRNITFAEAKRRRRSEYVESVKSAKENINCMTEINKRYARVRKQVESWVPPTESHQGIKDFALNQIDMCIYQEDDFTFYQEIIDRPFDDSDEAVCRYINAYVGDLKDRAKCAKLAYDEEIKRANEKTQFMQQFVNSLKNI